MSGLFVTLESTEGAGKGTARPFLDDCFQAAGRTTTLTREPGGTPLAETIREILLDISDLREAPTSACELMLVFSARQQHQEVVINPYLAKGNVVLCERFYDSTYAYQHFGRGLPRELIDGLIALLRIRTPDLTFLMDISPETGMQRAAARGQLDRFEKENMEFFHKARAGFLSLMAEDTTGRWRLIDASQPLPHVRKQFIDHLVADGHMSPEAVALIKEKYDVAT